MKLSKYFHYIEMNDEYIAIFNSILMQIIYVKKEKLDDIKSFKLSDDEKKIMIENGIYETTSDMEDIYNVLRTGIHKQAKIPTIMYLNVSTYCNLACKYCFIENSPLSSQKYEKMSFETAKIAIDKFLVELDKNEIVDSQIIFYGGEPLTNWNVIKDIINYIQDEKKSDITLTIITNGTLLNKEIISYLMSHHIGIGISIDGPKFINDKNRIFKSGNESVYEKAMNSIKLLNDMNSSYCVSATVTPDVVENEDEVLEWLIDNKIKNIFWNLYHYSTKDNNWEKHYNKMSDFILKSYKVLKDNNIGEEKVQEQIEMFLNQTFKFHSCGAVGLNQLTIKPNGDVCICQGDSRSYKNIVGNIVNDEISDILNNPKNAQWLKMYTIDNVKCKYCPAISVCGGGCPLQAEALFGKRIALDEASCIYYKKLLEWLIKQYFYVTIEDIEERKVDLE